MTLYAYEWPLTVAQYEDFDAIKPWIEDRLRQQLADHGVSEVRFDGPMYVPESDIGGVKRVELYLYRASGEATPKPQEELRPELWGLPIIERADQ